MNEAPDHAMQLTGLRCHGSRSPQIHGTAAAPASACETDPARQPLHELDPIEFIPASFLEPMQLDSLFERTAPVELDAGCGEGAFLIAMAERFPDRNYLGIERLLGRVRNTCSRAAKRRLGNIRVLRVEIAYAVTYLLPPSSIAVCHIPFPDPWPKRRHQTRRLINPAFLREVRNILADGGELRLKTDDKPYFAEMERAAAACGGFARMDWPEEPGYPLTGFERAFLEKGLPVYRMLLRKTSSPR
jgi:tRNA (guanine-N7-)-methyltransferase